MLLGLSFLKITLVENIIMAMLSSVEHAKNVISGPE